MNTDIHNVFSAGDCPPHEQLLSYFRGDLTGEEKNRIEHHLMECEMCSDELGGLSKMKDVEILPDIVAEIQSGLKAKQRKIIPVNPRILLLAAAATVVLVIGVGFLFRFIPFRQQEQALTQKTEKSVQPIPSRMSPSSGTGSAGKSLLAVVQPPKKKDVNKEEEKIVPILMEDKLADEETRTARLAEDRKALREPQQDSATQTKALGYGSNAAGVSVDNKTVAMQPRALAEKKTDNERMVKQGAGPGFNDAAMVLYHKADYYQASHLFEISLELDSASSANRYYLANCRFHLKEYLKAKQLLQKIISDPKDNYYQQAVELMKKVEAEIK